MVFIVNMFDFLIKRPVYLAFFCLSLLILLTLQACNGKTNKDSDSRFTYYLEGPTMGTQYHIKVVMDNELKGEAGDAFLAELEESVRKRLIEINQEMSTYIDDSQLSLFNKYEVDSWYPVSQDLFDVLKVSREVSEESSGAFDVTVGPLVNLWGFGPERKQKIPSDAEIDKAIVKTGYKKIQILAAQDDETDTVIHKTQVKKVSDVYVDLSAVAKGFACDLLARDFKQKGLEDFMIEIGGELFVSGLSGKAKPWAIGVEKPSLLQKGALQAVGISNVGVATSGDYRNYYEVDGVRASHTIDPLTGRPIEHRLVSVTVVADTAAKADAYATAINVLGEVDGFALAQKLKLAAYFIERGKKDYSIKYTPEFKQYMVEQ